MINQEILNYVKGQLGAGVGVDQIKSTLLANGWQEIDVNEAIAMSVGINPTLPSSETESNTTVEHPRYASEERVSPYEEQKSRATLIIFSITTLIVIAIGVTVWFLTGGLQKINSGNNSEILSNDSQSL